MTRDGKVDPALVREARERCDLARLIVDAGYPLRKVGSRWTGCCPFHVERTPSFVVYPDNTYHCFGGCGAHGDAISFVREKEGLTFQAAVERLAGGSVVASLPPIDKRAPIDKRRKWQPLMPVPDYAPPARFGHREFGEPVAIWWYQSAEGRRLMADVRYEWLVEGERKKAVITWCWARDLEGTEQWAQTRPSDGMPLYGLDRLAARSEEAVVLAEGCKAAEAAQRYLPGVVAMSWCGGVGSAIRPELVQWESLRGRAVWLWPDADWVGANAAGWILDHLVAVGARVLGVVDITGRAEGWDAADGEEADAKTCWLRRSEEPERVLRHLLSTFPRPLDKKTGKPLGKPCRLVADAGDGGPQVSDAGEAPPAAPPADDQAAGGDQPADVELNDIANASRFVTDHGRDVRFVADADEGQQWHLWDGRFWAPDQTGRIWGLAEQTAKGLAREYLEESHRLAVKAAGEEGEEAKSLRKAAGRAAAKADQCQSRRKLLDMLTLAQARPAVAILRAAIDRDEHLLCCLNGVVDLRSGRVYHHDRDYLQTRCCPLAYEPGLEDPVLRKVLRHVFCDDQAVIDYAQMVLGRSLFGNNDLEQIYVWQGEGGSGKGVLFEAIKAVLGTYAMTAEFQSFIKTQGTRVRDDLDRLREARFVLASESEKGEQLAAAVLKSISGGDTIAARALYGRYSEFRPRMTLHLQTNDRPRVDDRDSGMWRRLVLIPCGPTIPEEQRDPAIKRHLADPAKGGRAVLSWLIAGAVKAHGLPRIPQPEAIAKATAEYRIEQDPLKDFLAEGLRFASAEKQTSTYACVRDVLKAYASWADSMLIPPRLRIGERAIAERLEAKGCWRHKRRCGTPPKPESVWMGVTLPSETEHTTRYETYTPSETESETALGRSRVPVFPTPGKPPHVRAHARAPESFLKDQEQRNTGTGTPEPISDTNGGDLEAQP